MASPIRLDQPVVTPLERGLGLGSASSINSASPLGGADDASGAPGASFGDLFKRALNDTSGLQDDAQDMIGAFLRGEPVELHQVMAASEEAAISLELLVQIRNKLTDAYRAVMNVS
jgi:flagellar hook-basal body complex protein FliE